nr:ABC transporter permease [Cellulomonas sp. Y8]
MRRSLGRLTAAGVAVAIGTAFVAATLLAGDVMQRISYDSLTASYGSADILADAGNGDALTEKTVDAVRATPGVAAADPRIVAPYVSMSAGDRAISQTLVPVSSDPAFDTQHVTAGALPTADGEIALPERAAERLGVGVGDTITVSYYAWQAGEAGPTGDAADEGAAGEAATAAPGEEEGTYREVGVDAEVVGLTTDPTSAWAQYDGAALATTADTLLWAGWGQGDAEPTLADAATSQLLVAVDPGADRDRDRRRRGRADRIRQHRPDRADPRRRGGARPVRQRRHRSDPRRRAGVRRRGDDRRRPRHREHLPGPGRPADPDARPAPLRRRRALPGPGVRAAGGRPCWGWRPRSRARCSAPGWCRSPCW